MSSCNVSQPESTRTASEGATSAVPSAAQPATTSASFSSHAHHAPTNASHSAASSQAHTAGSSPVGSATTAGPTLSSTAEAIPLSSSTAPSVTLSGTGENQTELFSLAPGLAVFHFKHAAATPFAAFLLNERGDHLALLANGTVLDSRQVFGITSSGPYTLHMIAQDEWQARVEQPPLVELQRQATSTRLLEGPGSTATAPILLRQGSQRVEWTHAGTFPVTLLLWSLDGQQRVEIVSNSTALNGAASVTVPATGPYVLDVQANGAWTAAFSQP